MITKYNEGKLGENTEAVKNNNAFFTCKLFFLFLLYVFVAIKQQNFPPLEKDEFQKLWVFSSWEPSRRM